MSPLDLALCGKGILSFRFEFSRIVMALRQIFDVTRPVGQEEPV
jgi:hypothetical protein